MKRSLWVGLILLSVVGGVWAAKTTFDDAKGVVTVQDKPAISKDAPKGWTYLYCKVGGTGQILVKMPDGSMRVLQAVTLPTPKAGNQVLLSVRVAVAEVPQSYVPQKPEPVKTAE